MIQSMTGYGSATVSDENYKVVAELKSLNNKFSEINMKLPKAYVQYEIPLRNYLTKKLERGKINVMITVEILNPDKHKLRINKKLLKAYYKEMEMLRDELGLEEKPGLEFYLNLPDVIATEDHSEDSEEWTLIDNAVRAAADKLEESRKDEGKALFDDLIASVDEIETNLQTVQQILPNRIEKVRKRIKENLEVIRENVQLDQNRFEQELIYYIEKLDINEEIVRLSKHIDFFRKTIEKSGTHGKKINFISQEMGREINTIGSKANDADMQTYVVKMKEELEKIKEQSLNVL